MTDRELLELAATAANQERSFAGDLWSSARGCLWNPLEDDGDALRLAVKLKMDVALYEDDFVVVAYWIGDADAANLTETATDIPDLYGATRRAIVRAAAETGKSRA